MLRRSSGVVALFSSAVELGKFPSRFPHDNYFYAITEQPLETVNAKYCPAREKILEAWHTLAAVRASDPEVLAACLTLILETQPDRSLEGAEPLSFDLEDNTAAKATAAHPRAFKGTKKKPPKVAQTPEDLCAVIATARGTNSLLRKLALHSGRAGQILAKRGYTDLGSNLEEQFQEGTFSRFARQDDGQFQVFLSSLKVQPRFEAVIFPLIADMAQKEIKVLYDLYRRMEIESDPMLFAAVARLITYKPSGGARPWLQLLASRPPEQRIPLVICAINTGAIMLQPQDVEKYLLQLDEITSDSNELIRCFYTLFEAIKNHHDAQYVLDGMIIARSLGASPCLSEIPHSRKNFDREAALAIDHDVLSKSTRKWVSALDLWKYCGVNEPFSRVMPALDLQAVAPDTAQELIYFLGAERWSINDYEPSLPTSLKIANATATKFIEILNGLDPKQQNIFVAEISDFFLCAANDQVIEKNLNGFIKLLKRTYSIPIPFKQDITYTIIGMLEYVSIDLILNASDACLKTLAAQSKIGRLQQLVNYGLTRLAKEQPTLIEETLERHTTKLCKVAQLLGSLNDAQTKVVLHEFKKHELNRPDLKSLKIDDLYTVLLPHIKSGIPSPLPTKLSSYFEGKNSLSKGQLERAEILCRSNIDEMKLDLLKKLILLELNKLVPGGSIDAGTTYANQLLSRAKENRRAFRKFLKAVFEGDRDYVMNHPRSRRWLAKHPRLDFNLFRTGIKLQKEVPGLGQVTLSVEQDIFEILKLGAYANSCLGLNGLCSDSAMAMVLDINKIVVYARTENGRVEGRQMLAWTEAAQLACFSVYPTGAKKAVKELFRQYNQEFAAALGSSIEPPETSRHDLADIRMILSQYWWDDGIWDYEDIEDEDMDNEDSRPKVKKQAIPGTS
ncbi:MAG: hypothetical protein JST01_03635 [Cyanobacteria bacterium SZAS TMP-1]|nr:hypothetical protein [Cyanobacteria bacterium SZAS TMP-1]